MFIRQLDITTAYLNGTLKEEVYMEVPEHLENILTHLIRNKQENPNILKKAESMLKELSGGDKVCLMKRALYELRQAGRVWHKRLDRELRIFGAVPSKADFCVYLKGQRDEVTAHRRLR